MRRSSAIESAGARPRRFSSWPTVLGLCAALAVGPAGARPTPPLDVVLVTIDTLRADAVGFGGNPLPTTPFLDRLAASGRVFANAHAHNVVTLPSHANILTGLYPYQHGVRDNSGFRLPETVPTLATRLRDAGYVTAAFVGAFPLDSQFGLDRGFDVYDDHYREGSESTEFVLAERRGDEVVGLARRWWTSQAGRRRFLWVHLFDPHAPYAPPEPFASRFAETPYLGEVAAADAFLEPLLGPLLAGRDGPALLVVTADHGEALGDHGELTHGLFAYESTLHVPLLVWGPGVEPGRSDQPARHVDIVPTVLDALGLAVPPELPGRSLLRAPEPSPVSYFEALSANFNRGWAPLRGVLRDGRKLISLPLAELYDLVRDPGELESLAGDRAEVSRLRGWLPDEAPWPPSRAADLSMTDEARLLSLGYLAGSEPSRPTYGPNDDPKRLVDLDRKLHEVIAAYSSGRLADAVALARQAVEERPSMALGHSLLAQALLESGATAEALAVMQGARDAGTAGETLLRQLALTLAAIGRAEDGLAILGPLAAGDDVRSLAAYGLVLSDAGRQAEARAVLGRLLTADPDNPVGLETLALVHLRLEDWTVARELAERALELNPDLPRAWNHLGVARHELGDIGGAVEAWQRAVELDPGLLDALYNLGTRALDIDPERSLAALERFVATAPEERYAADLRRARVLVNRLRRRLGR